MIYEENKLLKTHKKSNNNNNKNKKALGWGKMAHTQEEMSVVNKMPSID